MRILLLSLLLWGISIGVMAQKQYKIFKTTEGVTLKDAQGKKVAVSKRMEVALGDVLHIPTGGKVGILENESKQIYYSDITGEVRVVKIIVDAKKQADNSIAAVNRQIINSITEQQQQGHNYSIVGAAHRGEGSDNYTQQVYASLYRLIKESKQNPTTSSLNLMLREGEEGTFYFSLKSHSDKPLFVNVVAITPGSAPRICLQPGQSTGTPYILLNAGGCRELSELPFACELGEEVLYLLFGSEQPFDSRLLQRLFEQGAAPILDGCVLYTSSCIK